MDECERKFQNGIPNTQTPLDAFVASMKPTANCTFEVDGKYAFVSPPGKPADTIDYIFSIPVYTKSELESAENGVYAWILCKLPGEEEADPQFIARKVNSVLEVASLHKAIARAVGAATIHGAGEVRKDGSTLTFNFLSGSYMQLDCDRDARETFMRSYLVKPELFGSNAKFAADMMQTFITHTPTMAELQEYANKGFRICLHDSKDECLSKKGKCDQTLKPQEGVMRGGDENSSDEVKKAPPSTPPRKDQLQRTQPLTQAQEARRQLALRNAGVPEPQSQVQGMGRRRKTRRGKKSKRRMTKKKW